MSDNDSVNQGVKEGKTAGIAIGCTFERSNTEGTIGFLMEKNTSIIEVELGNNRKLKMKLKSKELLALSKIITNTLK